MRSATPPADLLSAWLIKTFGSVAMPGYSHLLDEERDQIAALKAAGRSIGAIAKAVGRAKSTVSRELRRNAVKRHPDLRDTATPTFTKAWSQADLSARTARGCARSDQP